MRRKALILLPILVETLFLLMRPVSANGIRVLVWTAFDEEAEGVIWALWGYSLKTFSMVFVGLLSGYFYNTFGVKFELDACVTWDSDDSLTDPVARLREVEAEATFWYYGTPYPWCSWNGIEYKMLIAFTGQDMDDVYGVAPLDWKRGVVLVEVWVDFTDNIMQHEVSHLYSAVDLYDSQLDSVMNTYPTWVGFPYFMWVPRALTTNTWDSYSKGVITSNIERFGKVWSPNSAGGGRAGVLT